MSRWKRFWERWNHQHIFEETKDISFVVDDNNKLVYVIRTKVCTGCRIKVHEEDYGVRISDYERYAKFEKRKRELEKA